MTNGITPQGAPAQPNKGTPEAVIKKINKIKKSGIDSAKVDGRRMNKGIKGKSGRKPKKKRIDDMNATALFDMHIAEEVDIVVTDKKTATQQVVKKPRILVAMEKLFWRGTHGEGETSALDKWLDRAVGKPLQAIRHSGSIETHEQKKELTPAEVAASRAFNKNIE